MYTLDTGHHGCLVHTLQLKDPQILAFIFYFVKTFVLQQKDSNFVEIILPVSLKLHKCKGPVSVLRTIMISPLAAGLQATFFEYVTN